MENPLSVPIIRCLENGDLDTTLDDTCGNRVAGQAGGVMNVEFLHKALAVLFHSFDADFQDVRRHFVRVSFRDELQDFHFPACEFFCIRAGNA